MPRAYNFFSHTASSTRFFSSASANIFLSSPFSRSSSLSRRASFTSNCPNCRFHRWKLTSEMLCSRDTSRIDLPASASRKMRILSSVVYRLPFMLGPFSWPQTNISGGSKKRSHVNQYKQDLIEQGVVFPKVEKPRAIYYPLAPALEDLFDRTMLLLSRSDDDALTYNRYRAIQF